MNGSYDFSTIGSQGEVTYQDRKIETQFQFPNMSRSEMLTRYSQILEWLMAPGKQKLIYSNDFANYYKAKVDDIPSWDNLERLGTLKVDFIANPFKYATDMYGDDIWDNFNFLTDHTVYTNEFDINGEGVGTTVIVYNNGRYITPVVNCNVSGMKMNFTGNKKTYDLESGNNTFYDIRLKNGENVFHFYNANGKISISFRSVRL